MRRFATALLTLLLALSLSSSPAVTVADAKKKDTRSKACKKAKTKKQKAKHCKKKKAAKKKAKAKPKPGKPGTPAPPKKPALEPIDYLANPGLTQDKFIDIERVITKLPMGDGVEIHIETVKPKGATGLGVIMEASGYHGTLYDRTGTRILPLPLDKKKAPVGLTGFFPQKGYAVVMMDLRGTGKSQGCLDHLGPNDQSDLKAVVEWAAAQPWSNGRVGMVGHSYVGSTPQAATKLNPKGLVTTIPSAGLASIYDHQFQQGVAWNLQLAGPLIGYPSQATASDLPPGAEEPVGGSPTGDGYEDDRPQDKGCGLTNTTVNSGHGTYSGIETDWHKQRDSSKEATAWNGHVFLVHGVNDQAARIASTYWFHNRGGKPGDKTWIGQWDHGIGCCPNQRGMQWTEALHAWFDRQLLQRDVDTGPPVEIFLNDEKTVAAAIPKRAEIHTQSTWPGKPTMLEAGAGGDGSLTIGGSGPDGSKAFQGDPRGYNSGYDGTNGVEFVSAPLKEQLTLVGVPTLELAASTSTQRVDLIANVLAISPGGERRRISHCAINPLVREGIGNPQPVVPSVRMALKPPCWAMGHKLKAGDKLAIRVTASDPDHVPLGAGDPLITVFGGKGGTTLKLPVVAPNLYRDSAPLGPKPNGAGVTG